MASSEVAICNMALGHVGISIFIDSLGEASQAANVCRVYFEPARDFALADFDWNFARNRAAMADLGTPPTNWLYRYALPTDCLTVRHLIVAGQREPKANERIPYEIGEEGEVRVLYTDQPEAELVYTRRVTNPNLFSAQFVMALSYLLASHIAMPLAAVSGLGDKALKLYEFTKGKAETASLLEHQEGVERDSDFITGRN